MMAGRKGKTMTTNLRQQIESAISSGTNRLHDATRWYEENPGESRIIDDVADYVGGIIDAAVKEAAEAVRAETWAQGEAAVLKMCNEKAAILAIARELAAKHIRGQNACTCCGAVGYMGGMEHNAGCAVKRLDEFK
jgi:hypothetical protein